MTTQALDAAICRRFLEAQGVAGHLDGRPADWNIPGVALRNRLTSWCKDFPLGSLSSRNLNPRAMSPCHRLEWQIASSLGVQQVQE